MSSAINHNCHQRHFQLSLDTQTASIVGDTNNQPTMDPAKFDQLVKSRHIEYVLENHAGELNPEQLAFSVKLCPVVAIMCALNQLTQKQRNSCLALDPDTALQYHGYKLSRKEFDSCVRRSPGGALAYAADRLNRKQFDFCRRKMPENALEFANELLSPRQFALCVYKAPDTALKYAIDVLSPEQFDFCVKESPWETLLIAVGLISSEQLLDCASRCRLKLNNYLRNTASPSSKLVTALFSVKLSPSTKKALTDRVAKSI